MYVRAPNGNMRSRARSTVPLDVTGEPSANEARLLVRRLELGQLAEGVIVDTDADDIADNLVDVLHG